MVDTFLNEKFIGRVDDAADFLEKIKVARKDGILPTQLNIQHDEEYDQIFMDISKGRLRRPLIVVKEGKPLLTDEEMEKVRSNDLSWNDLVKKGKIEYVDAAEEEHVFVALTPEELTPDHTHLEISPMDILGITSSLIPYSNYGSSSRLIRGNKIQKQALGLYASNFMVRMDTDVNVLHYPQKPIVQTVMHDVLNYDKHPSGQNIVIALMSYEGYNMSDAIIFNQGSIQRGLARSTYFRPYEAEELRYSGGLVDEICAPDKEVKGYRSEKDYRHLEKDGIVSPGSKVKADDVIIGKTSPPRFLGEVEDFSIAASTRRESSLIVRHGEKGTIDMVLLTENEEGNKIAQVRLRNQRIPEIGDKFASRHGQKGVIGLVVPEEDMPFTASGVTPDLIFSPHGIPGRMTISHLIEAVAGKVGALSGENIDATTFGARPEDDIRRELGELGFREDGTETLYNGLTGGQYKVKIYIGNMYYLKLKHMVANKLHARAFGRIQLLTRQPIEGRAKGGGLRVGEMEKDCFVAHGASLLLKERFDSDKTVVYVCENCGMLAINDIIKDQFNCMRCGVNTEITPIEISYAFKLLLDELRALCIHTELKLKGKY